MDDGYKLVRQMKILEGVIETLLNQDLYGVVLLNMLHKYYDLFHLLPADTPTLTYLEAEEKLVDFSFRATELAKSAEQDDTVAKCGAADRDLEEGEDTSNAISWTNNEEEKDKVTKEDIQLICEPVDIIDTSSGVVEKVEVTTVGQSGNEIVDSVNLGESPGDVANTETVVEPIETKKPKAKKRRKKSPGTKAEECIYSECSITDPVVSNQTERGVSEVINTEILFFCAKECHPSMDQKLTVPLVEQPGLELFEAKLFPSDTVPLIEKCNMMTDLSKVAWFKRMFHQSLSVEFHGLRFLVAYIDAVVVQWTRMHAKDMLMPMDNSQSSEVEDALGARGGGAAVQ